MAEGNFGMKKILAWVLGVAIIAFILLIMVIIFGNLQGNTGFKDTQATVNNETITNVTNWTVRDYSVASDGFQDLVVTTGIVTNATDGVVISSGNYTTFANGSIVATIAGGASTFNGTDWNVSYTFSRKSQAETDSDGIITNYTKSAVNTSTQFPTVGTIIGIAVLLLVLIGLLIFSIRKMMGVTGSVSGSGKGSFKGGSQGFS